MVFSYGPTTLNTAESSDNINQHSVLGHHGSVVISPVSEHHVSRKLLSLQKQVLDCSLCLSGLSLESPSGVGEFLCHDSKDIKLGYKSQQHPGHVFLKISFFKNEIENQNLMAAHKHSIAFLQNS